MTGRAARYSSPTVCAFVNQQERYSRVCNGCGANRGIAMSLGGLLVGRGLITRSDLDAALGRQRTEGGRLGDNLIALGLLTTEELESVIHSTPPIPTTMSE